MDVQSLLPLELAMNRHVAFFSLLGVALLASVPEPGVAQVRGSMIPPETLEVSLQRSDRMFDRLDRDGDGAITGAEIAVMAERGRGQGGPGQGGGRGAGMMAQIFVSADADADGRITRDEMRASATVRFREQDRNGDGVVTSEERPAFPGRPGAGFGVPRNEDQMPPTADPSGD